jgi:glyoxylase-like metal-dependent hydrolase (beta-lactamase superfamily II)
MIETPPLVPEGVTGQVAERVHVIPDQRVEFVPNAGIVVGDRSVLAIETAMGPRNGQRILAEARRLGEGRKLLLTTTHFHPEHAFGAEPFAAAGATYVCNTAQARELADKGQEYIEMFSSFGPGLAGLLAEIGELVAPDVTFDGPGARLDLGGVVAELHEIGPAHTRGDMVVFLPDDRVLFAGDLVENRFLPIFPDGDASGRRWLDALDRLEALDPQIIVGGHGAVGGPELITALRDYLTMVRDRVSALTGDGRQLTDIEQAIEAHVADELADWDNQMWVKSAVDSFHGERSG